ncbi:MAG TPA: tryptophan synthase subunit alpha [Alkalispirochaeta sp.]|nr:tryptophan synthase subunit alpha [Alkalispirochaeta sp.]
MSRTIMAHMIPYYPTYDASVQVARALVDGGAAYLEVQFPYSDPTADGPAIQAACAGALDQGFRIAQGWEFVRSISGRGGTSQGAGAGAGHGAVPIFLMSYAGLVYAYGIDRFVDDAVAAGVAGLIVPDLPVDSDEGLFAAGRRAGLSVVPVISMGAEEERIRLVEGVGADYIYASLRRGITGSHTEIGEENSAFVQRLTDSGARVLAGFGIATAEQVSAVLKHAHAAVVGSAFVRAIAHAPDDPYPAVHALAAELSGIE